MSILPPPPQIPNFFSHSFPISSYFCESKEWLGAYKREVGQAVIVQRTACSTLSASKLVSTVGDVKYKFGSLILLLLN